MTSENGNVAKNSFEASTTPLPFEPPSHDNGVLCRCRDNIFDCIGFHFHLQPHCRRGSPRASLGLSKGRPRTPLPRFSSLFPSFFLLICVRISLFMRNISFHAPPLVKFHAFYASTFSEPSVSFVGPCPFSLISSQS